MDVFAKLPEQLVQRILLTAQPDLVGSLGVCARVCLCWWRVAKSSACYAEWLRPTSMSISIPPVDQPSKRWLGLGRSDSGNLLPRTQRYRGDDTRTVGWNESVGRREMRGPEGDAPVVGQHSLSGPRLLIDEDFARRHGMLECGERVYGERERKLLVISRAVRMASRAAAHAQRRVAQRFKLPAPQPPFQHVCECEC